jgi:hypothetical protein
VFPVYAQQETPETDYLTLDEALAQGVLVVEELPQPDVNRVLVSNLGDKGIYIMAGEIIAGGKQDRTVGKDTVVLPGVKKVALEVFCVEHGRWEQGKVAFDKAGGMAKPALRQATCLSRDQGAVWEEVAEAREQMAPEAESSSYVAVGDSSGVLAGTQPYIDALREKLARDRRAVGAVVAVNGEVICADVFNDGRLFQKQQGKLLRSYAVEALGRQGQPAAAEQPKTHDALHFIDAARSAEPASLERSGAAEAIQRQAPGVTTIQTNAPAAPAAGVPAEAAEQVPLHRSFYREDGPGPQTRR